MAWSFGVVTLGYGQFGKRSARIAIHANRRERRYIAGKSRLDNTHVLPAGRSSASTVLDQQMTRPDFALGGLSQVVLRSGPLIDLLPRESLGFHPIGLLRLVVIVIGHRLRAGPADFPDGVALGVLQNIKGWISGQGRCRWKGNNPSSLGSSLRAY